MLDAMREYFLDERAEMPRRQQNTFLSLLLVMKGQDQRKSDEILAGLEADVLNRLEVKDSGTNTFLADAVGLGIKNVEGGASDPVEVTESQSRAGIVMWNLTLRIAYRYTRGNK